MTAPTSTDLTSPVMVLENTVNAAPRLLCKSVILTDPDTTSAASVPPAELA